MSAQVKWRIVGVEAAARSAQDILSGLESVAIGAIVSLMDFMRQLRDISVQELHEQGSLVVVQGQWTHISFPENQSMSDLQLKVSSSSC